MNLKSDLCILQRIFENLLVSLKCFLFERLMLIEKELVNLKFQKRLAFRFDESNFLLTNLLNADSSVRVFDPQVLHVWRHDSNAEIRAEHFSVLIHQIHAEHAVLELTLNTRCVLQKEITMLQGVFSFSVVLIRIP